MAKVEVTGADEFPKEIPFFGWILLALLLASVVYGLYFGGRYFAYEVQRHEPQPRGNFQNGSANAPQSAPAHGGVTAPASPHEGVTPPAQTPATSPASSTPTPNASQSGAQPAPAAAPATSGAAASPAKTPAKPPTAPPRGPSH